MAIYKSQIQEAVEARKQEAGELAKKFSTEAGKRVAVVSWKMSSRTYLVGIQFIGHLSPDLKVGDEYLYDGETMTIQYIVEAPKEAVEQTETVEVFTPDVDLIRLEENQDKKRYQLALKALLALRKAGYNVLYGWNKGHGFWIKGLKSPRDTYFFSMKEAMSLVNN